MDAVKGNIYQILNGAKQFVIPVYQRTYSWEREQCARLWSDIVTMQTTGREGHFVGSIVNIAEKDMPVGVQKFMIIDGQQRLTTLTLLLTALRDYAKTHSDASVNPDKISNTLLLNEYESGADRYKLYLTLTDRDILIKKIEESPIPDDTKSRLLDNYSFFAAQISKGDLSPAEVYESIGKLQIVNITLDRQNDDPQAIFESLNSTGMDLKDSDLIRNHLLMGLNPDEQISVYNTIWRPTELLFDYEHQSELMDSFFRDYLTMKLGRIPKKNEVYSEFKDYHANCRIDIKSLCSDIYSFAKHYADMFFAKSADATLQSLYEDMKAVRMVVAYPFLLKVHDDCDKGIIDIPALQEIVRMSISYVVRRAVCNIPTNSLNKTFATMKNEIHEDDYLNSVKAYLITQESYKEFPDDKKFADAFAIRDIYNMHLCSFILKRLENWNNKTAVSLDNLTIEHIIPQNPKLSVDWIRALGDKHKEIQKQYLHTIGNLTLTAYNPEMSDSPFDEKLEMDGGFKESALRLNKYVVTQSSWGETQVLERAEQLGELAKKVWAYPVLTDDELAPYVKQDEAPSQYTFDSYDNINALNRMLFENLNVRVLNLGANVRREFKKLYVAYKAETNFVDVVVRKNRLRLTVNMKYSEIVDPNGLCKDITDLGRWGNGDVELALYSLENIDDVMDIIEQSYNYQMGE